MQASLYKNFLIICPEAEFEEKEWLYQTWGLGKNVRFWVKHSSSASDLIGIEIEKKEEKLLE